MEYLALPLALQIQPCSPAGVYLRWLSPRSTWEGWLFTGDTDLKAEVADATDVSSSDSRTTLAVRRPAIDTLTVRAGNLSEAQHMALSSLLDSPQVYRQMPNGSRQAVLVVPSSSVSRTSTDGKYELELSLKLPARNALTH